MNSTRTMNPVRQRFTFYLLTFPALLLFLGNATAGPTAGAHSFTNYNLGQNSKLSISTPAMNTQPSGSTMLVCIGRGDITAFTQVPTDNKGNTPYVQLGSTHGYVPAYPDSGTALYAFPSVAGGT